MFMHEPPTVASTLRQFESSLAVLRERIRREPGTLFAVLDACDEPRVPAKVKQLGADRAVSLYRGWAEADYWAIAPYLVHVDEPVLEWVVDNLWTEPWGIFAAAAPDLAALRKHFRRFLKVRGPDGNVLYFRFYDPRVLPLFLSTCNSQEIEQFLGPIHAFWVTQAEDRLVAIERTQRRGERPLSALPGSSTTSPDLPHVASADIGRTTK